LESGLDSLIPTLKGFVLGVCLLVLWKKGYKGLGIFDIDVIKFTTKVKVPKWVGIKFII
jgi:glutamine amidotransferase